MATSLGVPPRRTTDHTIKATNFAGPYASDFTGDGGKEVLHLLEHLNCSYLSSPTSQAVSLEELKQHAHSLTVLIRHLTASSTTTIANAAATVGADKFPDNEAFDWLNDLNKPYQNASPDHKKPLTILQNRIADGHVPHTQDGEQPEIQEYCPMRRSRVRDRDRQRLLPLSTHEAMAAHANDILERLDHDYSSEGGILSLLPVNEDDRNKVVGLAENTLLGQWIAYTRALVLRCHELEKSYAHALDVLAGEALVPKETISAATTLSLNAEPIVYDQGHFVLCNLHENKWKWLDDRFSVEEAIGTDVLISLEVPTRYYRLRGGETVFVVPQWEGTKQTQLLDERPLVVQVVKPTWPERATAWEERNKAELARLTALEAGMWRLQQRNRDLEEDVALLAMQKKKWDSQKRVWALADDNAGQKTWIEDANKQIAQIAIDREALDDREKDLIAREEAVLDMEITTEKWVSAEKQKWRDANS